MFGPLGLFYSTVFGGIVMTFSPILLLVIFFLGLDMQSEVISIIAGAAFLIIWGFYWLICMIWSAVAISQHNKRIMEESRYNDAYHRGDSTSNAPSSLDNYRNQQVYQPTKTLPTESVNDEVPNIQSWLRANPDKGVNDYYIKFRK
jgi:hypothetical protein